MEPRIKKKCRKIKYFLIAIILLAFLPQQNFKASFYPLWPGLPNLLNKRSCFWKIIIFLKWFFFLSSLQSFSFGEPVPTVASDYFSWIGTKLLLLATNFCCPAHHSCIELLFELLYLSCQIKSVCPSFSSHTHQHRVFTGFHTQNCHPLDVFLLLLLLFLHHSQCSECLIISFWNTRGGTKKPSTLKNSVTENIFTFFWCLMWTLTKAPGLNLHDFIHCITVL